MKTATAGLIAFLNTSTQMAMADLYTMETLSGVSRYTSADVDIFFGGFNYSSSGPIISRDSTRASRGMEVDAVRIKVAADASMLLEGLPFTQAALFGALDKSRITIQRVFMSDWGAAIEGGVVLFSGRVSDVKGSRSLVEIEVKSDMELLTVELPKNRYQSGCSNNLFGPSCGVQRGSYQFTSTVAAASTAAQVNSALAQATGYYDQGVFEFTSGVNAGLRRTIKSYTGGSFTFALPLPVAPNAGDTFKATAGCDKTQTTCNSKFGNLLRRRGYNYVPAAETVY